MEHLFQCWGLNRVKTPWKKRVWKMRVQSVFSFGAEFLAHPRELPGVRSGNVCNSFLGYSGKMYKYVGMALRRSYLKHAVQKP